METAAARERTPPLLAAAVFAAGGDTAPASATDPAHWRKTASGVKNWSEPTTTWDFNGLGPKTWWGALYYYRARWYEPNLSAFLERDPEEYSDGQNPFAFLRQDATNRVDPQGSTSRTDIDGGRLFYTWHMGWIDTTHAPEAPRDRNRSLRIAWITMRSAPAGKWRTITLSQAQGRGITYKKQKVDIRIRVKSSEWERANQLLYAWQLVSGFFEDYQGTYPQRSPILTKIFGELSGETEKVASSFSTEDLVSNLVSFYSVVQNESVDKLLRVSGRLAKTKERQLSYLVWDKILKPTPGGAPANWRPRYADFQEMVASGDPVVIDYYSSFGTPKFPHQFEYYWPDPEDVHIADEQRY